MANMFALILVIATLVTGFIWCIQLFRYTSYRRANIKTIHALKIEDLKKKNIKKVLKVSNLIEVLVSVFPILAVVLIIRSFIYEPFQIPSGSMMPTLLIGDFILVEKFTYGIKDPLTQHTLIQTGHPKRGDLVVFKYPLNPSLNYIKRVVGLPGDKVTYNPYIKELIVYSIPKNKNGSENRLPIVYTEIKPSEWIYMFDYTRDGKVSNGFFRLPADHIVENGYRMYESLEMLGTWTHRNLIIPQVHDVISHYYHQSGQPNGVWIVPEGNYFMMGDNRDNSADSRFWGFVPEKNLVGKATAIWMSFEKQDKQWPTGLRLNRIGLIH